MNSGTETPRDRLGRRTLAAASIVILAFLTVPILLTVPLSFTSGNFMRYPLEGVSLRWYHVLIEDPQWRRAILNTLFVGLTASVLSVLLGTAAAYGLTRLPGRARSVVLALSVLPIIVPPIIIALSSYLFYLKTGIANGYVRVILAHTVIGVPFVVLVVWSALQSLNQSAYRAALSLGARPWLAFRTAVLPQISRAMLGGGILAFAASIDELIIAMFVTTAQERTLPILMYAGLREQLSPAITAAATLIMVCAALILAASTASRGRPAPKKDK